MIDNIFKSDNNEAFDLFSLNLFLYFLLLGLLPSLLVAKIKIQYKSLQDSIFSRLALIGFSLLIPIIIIVSLSAHYSSFIREHKTLRFYANPSYYIYSTGKYFGNFFEGNLKPFQSIGLDAEIPPSDLERELIILVIGETARADHFSLNGYDKKTNPLLEKEEVISFKDVWSCGTSTAVSVPCLFSVHSQKTYGNENAKNIENVIDVAERAGVNVLWLDNNSDSKGVADRIEFIDYKTPDNNPICDEECRDVGMLNNLQAYVDSKPIGDFLIVLHQMGSHGPAYYKRYPKEFEVFTPACKTNQLEECTSEEIVNAYDNTILYTDYFLAKTIHFLKQNQSFESLMLYVSDHGESLGENGIYLHGLPYLIAPDSQKHIPLIMWFNEEMRTDDINYLDLKEKSLRKYSHDNVFHTLLGLLEIDSDTYDPAQDIIDHIDEDKDEH